MSWAPPSDASSIKLYHSKFPPSDSTDVTFLSCDGMLFCLHRKYLDTHADAFPGPEISVHPDEEILLTEPSEVLAIVFDLMYPRKQADIEEMAFDIVIKVAEAVEKYQIFSAMKVCELRLKQFIPTHPAEIMSHGIRHDYPALVNGALPRLSRRPLAEVIEWLPLQHHVAWCRHHEAWDKVFQETLRSSTISFSRRDDAISQILDWQSLGDVTILQDTLIRAARIKTHGFSGEGEDIQQAAATCLQKIQDMPPFSLF